MTIQLHSFKINESPIVFLGQKSGEKQEEAEIIAFSFESGAFTINQPLANRTEKSLELAGVLLDAKLTKKTAQRSTQLALTMQREDDSTFQLVLPLVKTVPIQLLEMCPASTTPTAKNFMEDLRNKILTADDGSRWQKTQTADLTQTHPETCKILAQIVSADLDYPVHLDTSNGSLDLKQHGESLPCNYGPEFGESAPESKVYMSPPSIVQMAFSDSPEFPQKAINMDHITPGKDISALNIQIVRTHEAPLRMIMEQSAALKDRFAEHEGKQNRSMRERGG